MLSFLRHSMIRRRVAVALALFLTSWILVSYAQERLGYTQLVFFFMELGYFIVPASLILALSLAYGYADRSLRILFGSKRYAVIFFVAALLHSGLFVYTTGMIAPPDEDSPAPPKHGFIITYQSYGPLAIWPNIEFWFPSMWLGGAVSVGTGLLVTSLAILMGMNVTLLLANVEYRNRWKRATGFTLGSFASTFCTSLCCCCTPSIFPLIALLLGSGAANFVSLVLVNPSSLAHNLLLVSNIALLTSGAVVSAKRITSTLLLPSG